MVLSTLQHLDFSKGDNTPTAWIINVATSSEKGTAMQHIPIDIFEVFKAPLPYLQEEKNASTSIGNILFTSQWFIVSDLFHGYEKVSAVLSEVKTPKIIFYNCIDTGQGMDSETLHGFS